MRRPLIVMNNNKNQRWEVLFALPGNLPDTPFSWSGKIPVNLAKAVE
jgi:hypothetical protein